MSAYDEGVAVATVHDDASAEQCQQALPNHTHNNHHQYNNNTLYEREDAITTPLPASFTASTRSGASSFSQHHRHYHHHPYAQTVSATALLQQCTSGTRTHTHTPAAMASSSSRASVMAGPGAYCVEDGSPELNTHSPSLTSGSTACRPATAHESASLARKSSGCYTHNPYNLGTSAHEEAALMMTTLTATGGNGVLEATLASGGSGSLNNSYSNTRSTAALTIATATTRTTLSSNHNGGNKSSNNNSLQIGLMGNTVAVGEGHTQTSTGPQSQYSQVTPTTTTANTATASTSFLCDVAPATSATQRQGAKPRPLTPPIPLLAPLQNSIPPPPPAPTVIPPLPHYRRARRSHRVKASTLPCNPHNTHYLGVQQQQHWGPEAAPYTLCPTPQVFAPDWAVSSQPPLMPYAGGIDTMNETNYGNEPHMQGDGGLMYMEDNTAAAAAAGMVPYMPPQDMQPAMVRADYIPDFSAPEPIYTIGPHGIVTTAAAPEGMARTCEASCAGTVTAAGQTPSQSPKSRGKSTTRRTTHFGRKDSNSNSNSGGKGTSGADKETALVETNATAHFMTLIGRLASVAMTARGRHLLTTVIRLQHQEKTQLLFIELLPEMNQLVLDPQGCQVVRVLIEHITTDQLIVLLSAMEPYTVLQLATISQQTRQVLQAIFEHHRSEQLDILVDVIASDARRLSMSQQGCLAMMSLIENALPRQRQVIVSRLMPILPMLTMDPYGNYVVQCILRNMDGCTTTTVICAALSKYWVPLCCNKYASNVVEKIVWLVDGLARHQMVQDLIFNEVNLLRLLSDEYGNFVLQAIVNSSNNLGEFQCLFVALGPNLHLSPFGRRIEARLRSRYLALLCPTAPCLAPV